MKPAWTLLLMPWGRVGSNLCLDVFKQSDMAVTFNEPLTGIRTKNPGVEEDALWRMQRAWLSEHVLGHAGEKRLIVNVSAVSVADISGFTEFLAESGAQVIILDRKSDLRTAISVLRARAYARVQQERTGRERWKVLPGEEVNVLPEVQANELRSIISLIRKGRTRCGNVAARLGAFTYYYEDILIDSSGFFLDLFEKVGLDVFPYKLRHSKLTPIEWETAVSNPELVAQVARELNVS